MVELGQSLDMERKTREAVMGGGVQHQPGQRIVSLEDVSAKKKRVSQLTFLCVCFMNLGISCIYPRLYLGCQVPKISETRILS